MLNVMYEQGSRKEISATTRRKPARNERTVDRFGAHQRNR